MTLASGISWPRKSGVRISTLQPGAIIRIERITPTKALGAVVGQVVAVDRGDDGVTEAHRFHLVGDPQRLQRVVPGRLAGLHVAEAAAAGADVAEDHEGGGPALPALADVRAVGLLADRVQVVGADLLLEAPVVGPARGRDFEPRRLAGAPEGDRAVGRRGGAPGLARERVTWTRSAGTAAALAAVGASVSVGVADSVIALL